MTDINNVTIHRQYLMQCMSFLHFVLTAMVQLMVEWSAHAELFSVLKLMTFSSFQVLVYFGR